MTELRRRMIEDLRLRNVARNTVVCYVRAVRQYAEFFGRSPDKLDDKHLRQYLLYLIEKKKVSQGTYNQKVSFALPPRQQPIAAKAPISTEFSSGKDATLKPTMLPSNKRDVPCYIWSDNGTEFTAKKVRQWVERVGVKTLFSEPGSPWEDGYCDSFNGRLRDDLPAREQFDSFLEAKVLIERYRRHFNTTRPRGS